MCKSACEKKCSLIRTLSMSKKAILPVGRGFEEKVLWLFQRKWKRVLTGEVSLQVDFPLNTVSYHLSLLEERGAIRRLSHEEKKQACLHDLCEAWALVDPGLFTTGE